jgi:quercetin dioxygenase-like cupin family protein
LSILDGAMSAFAGQDDLTPLRIWDGVVARPVEGERTTFAIVELDANCSVPEHRHHNEQIGVCIAGSVRFRIGDETRDIGPGDTWCILGDVPHQVDAGPDGALIAECFTPARTDWAELERLPGRPAPRWPETPRS